MGEEQGFKSANISITSMCQIFHQELMKDLENRGYAYPGTFTIFPLFFCFYFMVSDTSFWTSLCLLLLLAQYVLFTGGSSTNA